ncbi:helix-turn-helix domain-containing protein [Ekhidna sp.]|uniref:helix-turn-helix domain-containing protein n=1 Tax=Ekhidna sp. TaxID=2608089 RepID=UPI003C7AD2CB
MIQDLYIPKSKRLQQVINFMSYAEQQPTDPCEDWLSLFPNVTTNIAICLSDHIEFKDTKRETGVSTACTTTVSMKCTHNLRLVTVQFKPYGLYAFKRIPMHQLLNANNSMEMLFPQSDCERLRDELLCANEVRQLFEILENYMERQVQNICFDTRLSHLISMIHTSNRLTMDELSDEACLSARGLRKLFTNQIGLSPGYYQKIIRFNKTAQQLSLKSNQSFTEVALLNGFYDQAHFIKDFKSIAGISPGEYCRTHGKSSDFYNFRSEAPITFE